MGRLCLVGIFVLAAGTARADDDDEPSGPPVPYELYSIGAQVGATFGSFNLGAADQAVAPAVAVEVGVRTDPTTIVGLRIATARLTGISPDDLTPHPFHYAFVPIEIGAFAHAETIGRLWGEVFIGASIDRYVDDGGAVWDYGLYLGVAGGVDLLKIDRHRIGAFIEIHSELAGMSFEGASLGLSYRM